MSREPEPSPCSRLRNTVHQPLLCVWSGFCSQGVEARREGDLLRKEVGEFGMGEWKDVLWHCHHLVQAGWVRGGDVRLKGGLGGMEAAP